MGLAGVGQIDLLEPDARHLRALARGLDGIEAAVQHRNRRPLLCQPRRHSRTQPVCRRADQRLASLHPSHTEFLPDATEDKINNGI